MSHGAEQPRGQSAVPRSTLFEGRFGRMFRTLRPLEADPDALAALAATMKDSEAAASGDNHRIPAGYTYLGQFIDHDITFDPTSQLQQHNDPDALVDFRTPRFDLDSLYGSGPAGSPFLYESDDAADRGLKLLVGTNPAAGGEFEAQDLPRNQQGRALVGDPRNDVSIMVAQLHLLFIRFHNRVVDHVRDSSPKLAGGALLDECQRIVRWHYQWIVVHDFLEQIAGKVPGVQGLRWAKGPFMPVEFSGAAYRFGHSMVRPFYDLNDDVVSVPIFSGAADPDPLEHLGGLRRLPAGWTLDWSRFFKTADHSPQSSRKIDTKLSNPLFKLPGGVDPERRGLAYLNLLRGVALGLPSGQSVARALSAPVLTADDLGLDSALAEHTPLWYYLLREAEVKARGAHLGPAGARIVAEVLIGLLQGDPQSYVRREPTWAPFLPAAKEGDFTMADLVRFAAG